MHCEKWHKVESCDIHSWPDGYEDSPDREFGVSQLVGKYTRPEFCRSCAGIHHPPCCDFCCA